MTASPASPGSGWVGLGRIVGVFGVRGWVKVQSWTDPPEGILGYREWWLEGDPQGPLKVTPEEGRRHGKLVVARLQGLTDRESAEGLRGREIRVPREHLPPTAPGEHYQVDLIGLEVFNREGVWLGRVDHFVEAPAHPVMVVLGDRERWLPLVRKHIDRVDLEAGRMVVDWDADF
ncbi:MAG: ribosome maturation factor RimM [Steroidobacteraceae bacterium]